MGIAFSVLVFGLVIASSARVYISLIYVFVAIFAIFHGYANGLEITQLATSWSYVVWFMIGTVFLHIFGLYLGRSSEKNKLWTNLSTYAGAISAGIGLHIILSVAALT